MARSGDDRSRARPPRPAAPTPAGPPALIWAKGRSPSRTPHRGARPRGFPLSGRPEPHAPAPASLHPDPGLAPAEGPDAARDLQPVALQRHLRAVDLARRGLPDPALAVAPAALGHHVPDDGLAAVGRDIFGAFPEGAADRAADLRPAGRHRHMREGALVGLRLPDPLDRIGQRRPRRQRQTGRQYPEPHPHLLPEDPCGRGSRPKPPAGKHDVGSLASGTGRARSRPRE
uniref:ORF700 protein n=1 Tax=Cereibacter sphaeroides TaxID=1063 RepID=O33566_CERSP|nr:ORF700 [Cereibacter sphaeroides]